VALFLRTSAQFLNQAELQETEKRAKALLDVDGQGRRLQEALLQRAEEKENWLADWWLDRAYLGFRSSVVNNFDKIASLKKKPYLYSENNNMN